MKKNQSTSAKLTLEEFRKLPQDDHERLVREFSKLTSEDQERLAQEEIASLTPEQMEERMRMFQQAMRNYRVELGNAKLAANPGIDKVH